VSLNRCSGLTFRSSFTKDIRGNLFSQGTIRREDTVEAGQVGTRLRHQGGQAGDDVQGRINAAGAGDCMDAGGRATQGAVAECAGAAKSTGMECGRLIG